MFYVKKKHLVYIAAYIFVIWLIQQWTVSNINYKLHQNITSKKDYIQYF